MGVAPKPKKKQAKTSPVATARKASGVKHPEKSAVADSKAKRSPRTVTGKNSGISVAPEAVREKPRHVRNLPSSPVPEKSEAIEPAEVRKGLVTEVPAIADEPVPVSEGITTALSSYMREAERYPILSREEEYEVAKKFRETQDPELAKRLITSNLKLVVKIAWEYHNAYKNILDLVQEGNIGLMMAVKNFDPLQGVRLSSYAQYWIRAYMLRYLVNTYHLVKVGTTQAQRKLFFNLRKEKAQLEREGFKPTTKLLAERLDVKESEVAEMDQRLSQGEVSLDAPLGPDSDLSLGDTLSGDERDVDERLADHERMERFRAAMNAYRTTLDERDALIFDRRLDTDNPITLQELGDKFGISKERARQLEERIKLNFRKFLDQNKDKYAI